MAKAKQTDMFPDCKKDAVLERVIDEVYEAQTDRMAFAEKERTAREKLSALLRERKFTVGKGYKRGPYVAFLDVGPTKAKVRKDEEE